MPESDDPKTDDLNAGLNVPETPDVTEGREKIAAAAEPAEQSEDPMIAALLRERDGYERFDKGDRVKAVDAELKRRGHKAKGEPKGRSSRESKQSTADAPVAKKTAAKVPDSPGRKS